ncbi:MAG: hypothetical protein AWM53_00019 [Candidatus Dichloromethanomonas elyunquensis]|nr:MAG: hypothetical protein AWM53_00019 [Candidatus Dichloromethanomonas elyunquensis]
MDGLRYIFGLGLIFFAVMIGLQSGTNQQGKDLLKTTDVVEAFYQKGTKLTLSQDLSPSDFRVGNKMPVIYNFPGSGEKLFIYEFSDINKRNNALMEIGSQGSLDNTEGFKRLEEEHECLVNPVRAKNIILIYVIAYDSKVVSEITDVASLDKFAGLFAPNLELVKKITLEDLNHSVRISYRGNGQSWDGKAVLEYYQFFWKDENGINRYESWSSQDFWIKYLGKDSSQIRQIACSFQGPLGNGQGVFEYSGLFLDKDGYLRLGSSGGNGVVNAVGGYTLIIDWEDKSETFTLQKIN